MADEPEPTLEEKITNTIDELMDLDPLEMTAENIDGIIAYHRRNRAIVESGGKLTKVKKDTGPKIKLDLEKLGLKKATPKMDRKGF